MKKRIGRNDFIFIFAALAGVLAIAAVFYFNQGEAGQRVIITVDGEEYGSYALSQEQEIPILIDGHTANLLRITDGKADMVDADCPDGLCVHQKAISRTNETIVCLPHKVVVQVTGSVESEFDSIAK